MYMYMYMDMIYVEGGLNPISQLDHMGTPRLSGLRLDQYLDV
jgi:hypothetical protein